jgi:type I restriction enzyme, S subunit
VSGWETVALEEVADIERDGVAASAIRDGTLYVGLENIQSGGEFLDVRAVDEGELASSKFVFTEEHLLYGKLRPYLAKIARPTFAGVCSTDILPIKPGPLLDRDYLSHFLRQPGMVDFANSRATGANLPRLSPRVLASFEIPLPPLPEQRRIAAILDQADTLRTQRRAALAQLDSLTQSLFLDMFGDPVTNPHMWPALKVEQIADQVTDGEHLTPKRELDGIKLLSARNVRNGYLDFGNVDFVGLEEHERIKKRCSPVRGDVLISCSGSIGRVASVETDEPLSLVRSVAMIRPKQSVVATKFLEHYLRTPAMNAYMVRRANASSQANLFQGPIREMPVLLPPLPLQQTFATRVLAIEALKAQHRAALAALDELFASLQQRAFAGTL